MSYLLQRVVDTDDVVYQFTTTQGFTYLLAVYTQEDYFFLSRFINSISITPKHGEGPHDNGVMETVVNFMRVNLEAEPTLVYSWICSSTDKRHDSRNRLFKILFNKYSRNTTFEKIDYQITDTDGTVQFFSIIISTTNPNYQEITDSLSKIITTANREKPTAGDEKSLI